MSRFFVINLIDKIFVTVSVFLIIYAWINFYVRNLWATFILSLIFSFAVVFLIYFFLGKKQEKENLTKKEIDEMNKCFLAFRLISKTDQLNLIKELLKSEKKEIVSTSKKLKYSDETGKHLIILATNMSKITDNDLIALINENFDAGCDCFDIYCNATEVVNAEILKNKKIVFIDCKKLFDKFKQSNIFPNTENLCAHATKIRFKDVAKSMFRPKKARSYFLCGLILIFSSIILPYNFYYIIFGSMLLLFAVICKILPKVS